MLYIFEKCTKNLKIPVSLLSFVNNGLLVSQEKSLKKTNLFLFCSYNIISSLLIQFRLVIKYRKTEVFYFSRSHGVFNLPPLDLSLLGGTVLFPKDTWCYLGFIFDKKLSFHQYVKFYANKAISTVKCMKMLENSMCSLLPYQKQLFFYRIYILSIALYEFAL